MQFPVPAETFVSAQVSMLVALGQRLRVHGLRRALPGAATLARERGVDIVPTTHNSIAVSARGIWEALRRPATTARLLRWLVRRSMAAPKQLATALVLVPRAFAILADLEADPPDVLHLAWGHYPAIVARLVQLRMPNVVTSISLGAYDLTREWAPSADVCRSADLVRTQATVNVAHIARFSGVAPHDIAVVHHGVDLAKIARLTEGSTRQPGRLTVAGRLVPQKRVGDAIRVLEAVRRHVPYASLRVLGDGPQRDELERLAQRLGVASAVEFLGHVPHDRVLMELARTEVFLLLTGAEGERLPNVVKEGMACGCVCVTTPSPGIEELVEHGVTGFVMGTGAVEEAAAFVVRVLVGAIDTASMRSAARRHVAEHFDHETSVRRLLELWRERLK